ncbi:response regulator transcription factor [Vagococcus sp. BWB3-3]|uniref:Response regulator transcription factor n=1 Tax=Vagococcus allomyrinae TaxID=2794353 RepID=A0A940SV97_9ENTE|nr:response regulator transcription factor [Vagococcus allomyrinae]MBP1041624.1 response regulator transcription factor [Vagococcus allomyrinae]
MTVKILLVEDEDSLANFVSEELTFEGYQVIHAKDGAEALTLYEDNQSVLTLIVLDWMLPVYDGITVARRIRKNSQIPIIMMTARDQVTDKITGLDTGADDYITKPFDIEELLARIRVILRRAEQLIQLKQQPVIYQYEDLVLDTTKHLVQRFGEPIPLTQKEFELILALIKRPEEVLSRDELLNAVWGYDYFGQTNTVDVYIRSLRNKMDYVPEKRLIQTVRGVGYVMRTSYD